MIRNTIIKYYQQYKHIKLFSIAMFASIAVYLFTNSLSQSWPYPVGDAVEYLLVSEAISKHGSPLQFLIQLQQIMDLLYLNHLV